MKLSIVTSLFYSAPYIREFYERIVKSTETLTKDFEIIFVNDGSPDNVLEIALNLFENDRRIKIIDLSRNFGHHKAIMTGLSFAEGDYIFLIDADLEEQPEWIEMFWDELNKSEDADVVFGVQNKRKGGFFERISGALFFNIFNLLSNVKVTKNVVITRLMSKRYVKSLLKHNERELVFVGLCELTGYNQKPVIINKRYKRKTSYSLLSRVNLAINFIASFSSKPLIFIFYLGMFITLLSSIFISVLIIRKVLYGVLEGWTSVIASVWFLGGIVLFSLGIIGIYLSKIFIEVKQRPYTIIKTIYSNE